MKKTNIVLIGMPGPVKVPLGCFGKGDENAFY